MSESTLNARFCAHASLAAIGTYLRQLDLLAPIKESVQIKQKTVKYTPFDKLREAFVLLLSGAHRMVESNTSLRADPVLCEAFGIPGWAEQSVVQDTLDACTDQNVDLHRPECRRDAAGDGDDFSTTPSRLSPQLPQPVATARY